MEIPKSDWQEKVAWQFVDKAWWPLLAKWGTMKFELAELAYGPLASLCLRAIKMMCRYKDEGLASRIHELAGRYQKRPQEGWMPPDDWPKN